jgi:hypothetical protein
MNTFTMWVGGMLLGIGIGTLVTNFVIEHNAEYRAAEYRKALIELGVGSYNSRTGAFEVNACTK